jgi:signal transduction histidine kinase
MPSSTEHRPAGHPSAEAALLEKIEALSFLRTLNDRLARVPNFTSACRALVDLLWEEGQADAAAFVSVDPQRRRCRLEATAPAPEGGHTNPEFDAGAPPFCTLLAATTPVLALDEEPPAWLAPSAAGGPGVLLGSTMRVRDVPTGMLFVYTRAGGEAVRDSQRLLAITATSAALALDVSRNESREEFLAMLRHDINNPIAAALGAAELIGEELRERGIADLEPLARSLAESLEAVVDLVSNYLHMAAIDSGAPRLKLEAIDLGGLVGSVVEQLRVQAAEKDLTVTCHGVCPDARADRRQLARVVTNLVSNAIKYTPPAGRIDVSVAAAGTGGAIRVADTGYGLTLEDQRRLFTKYGRFHRDRGIPGTGLGLYISKAIVEAHGGRIDVESAPGRGTTFTVRLPDGNP